MPERPVLIAMHGSGHGPSPALGIRARLLLLVLAAVLPVLSFAGIALSRFAEAQEDALERSVLTRAEGLARTVDAEFEALASTLQAIATTDSFRAGYLPGIYRHLVAVAAGLDGMLTLRDADGHLLLHSHLPYGEANRAETRPPGWVAGDRPLSDGPQVTDLFVGRSSGQPSYGLILPVEDGQGRRMLLAAGFPASHLTERLRQEVPEPRWTAVIVDRTNRIVASNRQHEANVGRDAGPSFHQTSFHVLSRRPDADGSAVVAARGRTAAGWVIEVSLPAEVVDAPVRRAVRALIGTGAVLLACALLLALFAASRIERAMRSLSAAAAALGRGEPVPAVRTVLREVNAISAVLADAADTIAARDAALREREAQLARTQRLARVGGFEIAINRDPLGLLRFHNFRSPEYLALHGLGPEAEEEPHENWVLRIHPEDRARVATGFEAALEGSGNDYSAEYRVLMPSGEVRWISALAEIERDAQGQAIRMRGVHVDVSALRHTEARLAENQAALAAAEERLRMALEAGGLIAFDVDVLTRQGVFSPGHFALLGLPVPPDGRGDLDEALNAIHPDDRDAAVETWRQALAEGNTVTIEYRILPHSGGERWIAVTGRSLATTTRFVGVYADITERRTAQAVLEARVAEAVAAAKVAQAQLAQARKMEALGQLTGGVAHDFNNLLQVVTSGAALLSRRPAIADDPKARRLVEGVAGAAERGAALTRRMLAFARRQELRLEAVDTAALIGSLRDILARSIGPATPLEVELPEGLWWVHADPNQLELALLNLCVNARDAMPLDRFPHGRLRITARNAPAGAREERGAGDPPPPGDCLVIAVSDEGLGMDAETLARATEPFFTTKGVGRGTGLGLSMVHGLCAQSGGALRLVSAPGQGTTAEIWLPRADPVEGPASNSSPDLTAAQPARPMRRLSILVVDDDPLVLSSSVALLTDLGHEAHEADSAAAALDALRAGRLPDLIVTDHAMPGMTGAELAARIRALYPALPVILASGYADLPFGETPELPRLDKPFGREALAAAIAAAVPAERPCGAA
ncbi:PAS domain-containing protein [Roseomonas chloroacetimidivorans]|uniref:PAS domain-containing protein n=1 Tax=Roseomonas chloroacetimidivorans TaxID=1766656 RepID=UPI003C75502D